VYEVILSLQRLVKKYGHQLRVEWDLLLPLLSNKLRPWLGVQQVLTQDTKIDQITRSHKHQQQRYQVNQDAPQASHHITVHDTRIPQELLSTVGAVVELYINKRFHGLQTQFFALLHTFLPFLSETVQLMLLEHYGDQARPGCHPQWLKVGFIIYLHKRNVDLVQTLCLVMDSFFVEQTCIESSGRESRYSLSTKVRGEALKVLHTALWASANVCEDRVIDSALLPYLGEVT
jgi:hypothetical protein